MRNRNLVREAEYARALHGGGRELLTPREAARLFGVHDATIPDGRIAGARCARVRAGGCSRPAAYKLRDLQAYFAPRSEADPALLEADRANGVTCYVEGAGGWLLLCEAPGLRTWDEAAS